ncbi:MAG: hypothetical protein CSB44_08165 [Gammaproteobacteria bacterium]|nr:MAG: hypothetical protein CSB44_08165 [Gammaproteobacteria bacterium]
MFSQSPAKPHPKPIRTPRHSERRGRGNRLVSAVPRIALLLAALLGTAQSMALEYQCSVPHDTRYIRVDIPGEDSLCDVSVTYSGTGEKRVMWFAQNSSGFCLEKAEQLRNKYTSEWDFDCRDWPDNDGVAELDDVQRRSFDQSLRRLLDNEDQRPSAVRAIASPSGNKLAVQYFFDESPSSSGKSDRTELLRIDDDGAWRRTRTIDDLASHVVSDPPVDSALIDSLGDDDTLGVLTVVTPDNVGSNMICRGKQMLQADGNSGELVVRTPHRYSCVATFQ